MSTIVNRLMGQTPTNDDVVVLDLQLRMLVAMAAVDERISPLERREISAFITRNAITTPEAERLAATAERLLATPPRIEELLEELARYAERADVGELLATELAHVARSDEVIDHREEVLFAGVCELFGVDAGPLRSSDGDDQLDITELRGFVERLAAGDWRR